MTEKPKKPVTRIIVWAGGVFWPDNSGGHAVMSWAHYKSLLITIAEQKEKLEGRE